MFTHVALCFVIAFISNQVVLMLVLENNSDETYRGFKITFLRILYFTIYMFYEHLLVIYDVYVKCTKHKTLTALLNIVSLL
jgi:hypothetical protein